MSYYTDLDEELGQCEEAERDMRELDYRRKLEEQSQRSAIKNEVAKQLKAKGIIKTPSVVRGKTIEVSCKSCKSKFYARVSDRKRGWGKFCSKSCKAISQPYNGYLHR